MNDLMNDLIKRTPEIPRGLSFKSFVESASNF